ncbi:ester cyclase [Streptomyces sp. 184]|uniref:ester cyclase n=1 Tax=Streptomyces sp. 184 TaxID=1827526 RepID=UPI0038915FE9
MDTNATRDLFDRYHACWEARDPARIAALHTPDSIFHLHSSQPPAQGREAIRTAAAETFALVPDLTFHLLALRVGDDFWAARMTMTGTSAAGNEVAVDLADFVLVRDGEVLEKHSYVDGPAMTAALTPPS